MSLKIRFDAFPTEWMRSDYTEIAKPTASGGAAYVLAPAIPIRLRNPAAAALPDDPSIVRGMAAIDTGAAMPFVPMWGAQEMGIRR